MTAPELSRRLAALGISQRGFARRVGANERTVRRWVRGERTIPPWVQIILDMVEKAETVDAR